MSRVFETHHEGTCTDRDQLETVAFNTNNVVSLTYDSGQRESTRTLGNGLVSTMTYNLDNTLDDLTVATRADLSFSYTYDANKNVTAESSTGTLMSPYGKENGTGPIIHTMPAVTITYHAKWLGPCI